jgi:acetyl-CoA carboxylase biotin carboxyl carrier protein
MQMKHRPVTEGDLLWQPSEEQIAGALAVAGAEPGRAPLMSTFHRAPMPGARAFVEVGTPVEAKTVVGIVETMTLMTSVHAGVPGRVRQTCLNNDEFAEQGAALMWIAP